MHALTYKAMSQTRPCRVKVRADCSASIKQCEIMHFHLRLEVIGRLQHCITHFHLGLDVIGRLRHYIVLISEREYTERPYRRNTKSMLQGSQSYIFILQSLSECLQVPLIVHCKHILSATLKHGTGGSPTLKPPITDSKVSQ